MSDSESSNGSIDEKMEIIKKFKNASKELFEFLDLVYKKNGNLVSEFEKLSKQNKKKIIKELKQHGADDSPVLFKIVFSEMPSTVKSEILKKYNNSDNQDKKFEQWMDGILRIPFGQYCKLINVNSNNQEQVKTFLDDANLIMKKAVYGHENAKHKIIQYLAQLIQNPSSKGFILGIHGPAGNGKTTLVEHGLAKILNRPFASISLGGATDSSYLNGHGYTYEGSTWGQIIDVVMRAKVMNPIIYFDELDKVSKTTKGDEIINLLIHLTDPVQNVHFQDRYFGNINIDLSQVMFVFSYNRPENISSILLDRIFKVETRGFSTNEKICIARDYLIPSIVKDIGLKNKNSFDDEIIENLIKKYTWEGGVRGLKDLLYEIYREINLQCLRGSKKRKIYDWDTIKSFIKTYTEITPERIHEKPTVGKINGLYYCSGLGGILPIEMRFVPGEAIIGLQVTGNFGKIIGESVTLAKTIAWNLLPEKVKAEWFEKWKTQKTAIHVHALDMSTEKNGPSAGCALSICVYSLLMNLPIDNTIAMTGEISLSGDVLAIGGLKEKIHGAINSGCTKVYFPKQNLRDVEKILDKEPNIKKEIELIPVDTINEIIKKLWN